MTSHAGRPLPSEASRPWAPRAGAIPTAPRSPSGRIAALDMLRGLALVCIMLNHMPAGLARHYTLSNFFLFDAAELFVLLSGFLVGLVWRQVAGSAGEGAARRRFGWRAFEVWRAMLVAAVLMAALSLALQDLGLRHTAIWNGYAHLLEHQPLRYLLAVGSLYMQPNLLDVLALYTLLLAVTPLVMPGLSRRPWLTALAIAAVWWFAVPLNNLIPNERPNSTGLLFNPFGWQALFFTGAGLGLHRRTVMDHLRRAGPWVTTAALAVLGFGTLVLIGWWIGEPAAPLRDTLFAIHGVIEKWPLDGWRYASILAAAWLVAAPLAPLFAWLAGSGPGRALATIGRGGLASFTACVLISVAGDAAQVTAQGWAPGILAVDLWVVLALWVAAELIARAPRLPALPLLPLGLPLRR